MADLAVKFLIQPQLDIAGIKKISEQAKATIQNAFQGTKLLDANSTKGAFEDVGNQAVKAGESIRTSLTTKVKEAIDTIKNAAFKFTVTADTDQATSQLANLNSKFKEGQEASQNGGGIFGNIASKIGELATPAGAATAAIGLLTAGLAKSFQVGSDFQTNLASVSAVTGATGEGLDKIGQSAQDLAAKFGGGASEQLGVFQTTLSKIGPQLAESPKDLATFADSVNLLSKTDSALGAAGAVDALTGSMLQFGVNVDDTNEVAKESARFINVLAASAGVGSASVSQVSESIAVVGATAKNANISFEETNAALQVLATKSLVGSQAGTGLTTVLNKLQAQSKDGDDALQALGTSSAKLGELLNTKGIGGAIDELRGAMGKLGTQAEKNALLNKLFGEGGQNAAAALLSSGGLLNEYTGKVTGTSAATEQAAINMATLAERISRAGAVINNLFIKAFLAIEPVISKVAGVIGDAFGSIVGVIQGALSKIDPKALSTAFTVFKTTVLLALSPLIPVIGAIVLSFEIFKNVVRGVFEIAVNIFNKLYLAIAPIVDPITKLFSSVSGGTSIFTTFQNVLSTIFDVLIGAINIIVDVFVKPLSLVGAVIGTVISAFIAFGSFISSVLSPVIQSIGKAFTDAGTAISSGFNYSVEFATALFNKLYNVVNDYVIKVLQDINKWITEVVDKGFKFLNSAIEETVKFFNELYNNIVSSLTPAFEAVQSAIDFIIDSFFNGIKAIKDFALSFGIVRDAVEGLQVAFNFISGMIDKIVENFTKFTKSVGEAYNQLKEWIGLGDKAPKKIETKVEQKLSTTQEVKTNTKPAENELAKIDAKIGKLKKEQKDLTDEQVKATVKDLQGQLSSALATKAINQEQFKLRSDGLDKLTKKEKESKDKSKSLLDEIAKNERENFKARELAALEDIKDEKERAIAKVNVNKEVSSKSVLDEIDKLKREKNLIASERIKLTGLLNDKIAQIEKDANQQILDIDTKFQLKKLEEQRKADELIIKNQLDTKKKEIELLQANVGNTDTFDALKVNLEKQKELRLEIIKAEADAQIKELAKNNAEYLELDKKYLEAKADLIAQNNLLTSQIASGASAEAIELSKNQIKAQTELVDGLQSKIKTIEADAKKDPLVKTIILKADDQSNKAIEEFNNANRENQIKAIKDSTERESALKIFEAEKTLAKELELAKDNEDAKTEAYLKFNEARNQAEDEALRKSTNFTDVLKVSFLDIADSFKTAMISSTNIVGDAISALQTRIDDLTKPKDNKDALKSIADEEKASFESFKKREISTAAYFQKAAELELKRNELSQDNLEKGSLFELKLRLGLAKSFENISKRMSANMIESQNKYLNSLGDANISDTKRGELLNQTYSAASQSVAASFGAMLASGTVTLKGMLGVALDALQSLVPIFSAQIYGAMVSSPNPVNVSTLGAAGLAAATGITLGLTALVQLAKAAAGFKTGVVDLKGPGTETSDDIPAWLSKRESVLTAQATKADGNADFFRWANQTGGSIVDYIVKVKPELVTSKLAISSLLQQKAEQLAQQKIYFSIAMEQSKKNESANVDNSEIKKLLLQMTTQNDQLIAENKKLHRTFSSKQAIQVSGTMEMDTQRAIGQLNKAKIKRLSL